MTNKPTSRPSPTRSVALTLGLCVAVTLGAAFSPGIRFAYHEPGLHIMIETAAAMVAALAAFLVIGRFRRSTRLDDLLLASSLSILAFNNLALGAIPAALTGNTPGPGWPWAQLGCLAVGSVLFGVASFTPGVRVLRPRRASIVAATTVAAIIFAAVAIAASGVLGPIPATPLAGGPPQIDDGTAEAMTIVAMLAFAIAAVGLHRRSVETGDAMLGFFAAGATASTFARLDFFLYPSLDAGWVYVADLLRLLAYMLMAAGAAYEIAGYWRSQSEAAVLEERRRLARDLHDGLAQELAYITRLTRQTADPTPRPLAVQAAAERALDESRRAIAALTRPLDEPLHTALAEAVEQVAARCEHVPTLRLDLPSAVKLDRETREAVIRVACEAVANAAKHGHADNVHVSLRSEGAIELDVEDDGAGFDVANAGNGTGRFGITSMRERVEALGGSFTITSQLGTGTRVEVTL